MSRHYFHILILLLLSCILMPGKALAVARLQVTAVAATSSCRISDPQLAGRLQTAILVEEKSGCSRLVMDRNSNILLLSNHRQTGTLTSLDSGKVMITSPLLSGTGRKGLIATDSGWLVTVDNAPGSGNSKFGIFALAEDGSFRQFSLAKKYNGLADIINAPDRGWLFCDFEAENIFHLPGEGIAEKPLLTDPPKGLYDLALDRKTKTLYAVEKKGEWPFADTSVLYRIKGDSAEPLHTGQQIEAVAVNSGALFPAGVYFSDRDQGTISRITSRGKVAVVISGLPEPSDLLFDRTDGALLVICSDRAVFRFGPAGAPVPEAMQPFRFGRVTIPEGPLQDVLVTVDDRQFLTDKKGIILLDGIPAGMHRVQVAHDGYRLYRKAITIRATDNEVIPVALEIVSRKDCTGRVRLQNGEPVAGAWIVFTPLDKDVAYNAPVRLTSDFSGRFVIPGLARGRYRVSVAAPGCIKLEQTIQWPLPTAMVDLVLKPVIDEKRDLTIHLVNALSGQPVAEARLTLSEAGDSGIIQSLNTDRKGMARFRHLHLGSCNLGHDNMLACSRRQLTLTVRAKGYSPLVLPFELGRDNLRVAITPQQEIQEKEPNNSPATAQEVLPGLTIVTRISANDDRDFFRFRLQHRARVVISTGDTPPIATAIHLFDSTGKKIKSTTAYSNNKNTLQAGGLMPGLYVVKLEEWGNNASSDKPIALHIAADNAPDALEPDDTRTQARLVAINQEIRGTLFPIKDQDWYRFSVKRPGRIRITVKKSPIQRSVYLYRKNEEKQLAGTGVYSNQQLVLEHDLSPGEYLVCVREWGDNNESLEPYTMRLEVVGDDRIDDPSTEKAPLRAVRDLEPNGVQSASIWPLQDRDLFRLQLPSAGRLVLQGHSVIQLQLILKNAQGKKLLEQGTYSNLANILTYDSNGAETLFLEVREWGDNSASPALYVVKSHWFPADGNDVRQRNDTMKTATMIRPGTLLSRTILPLKDIDLYRLHLEHPGYLRVTGKAPGQLRVRWLDSKGNQLAADGFYTEIPIRVEIPVLAGTFFLEVREWGDNSVLMHPYRLTVTHELAEPGETTFTETDHPRSLQKGKAQSFVFDHKEDIDTFSYRTGAAEKVFFSIRCPLQTQIRIVDSRDKKVLFDDGFYAGNKIVVPVETRDRTTLLVYLTEWGNNQRSNEPGYIIADTGPHDLPLVRVESVPCGSPGTACFSIKKRAGDSARYSVQIDADGNGSYNFDISEKNGGEYHFPKPGIYPIIARIKAAAGPELLQRTWVDVSRAGEQMEMQLSMDGLANGRTVEKEEDITLYAKPSSGARMDRIICTLDDRPLATLYTPPYTIALPWNTLNSGEHVLRITGFDSRGKKKSLSRRFSLSPYFGLLPENGAKMTGQNVRITWSGDRFGPAIVRYRRIGDTAWNKVVGESGRRRSVLLTGLTAGERYEYQVVSGKKPSSIRSFHLLKGLAFGQSTYGVNINRDYNQRMGISVRNNGDSPLQVRLECGRPEDPLLLVGFVGAGSEDRPFTLKPGEERQFMLGLSAQDVLTATHSFPVRIISQNGLSDEAMVNVSVRLPDIKLQWRDLGPVPYGLGHKFRLSNRGDTVTDLAIFSKSREVYIVPTINHGLLPAGKSVEITVYPRLFDGFTGVSARIQARGLDRLFPTTFSVRLGKDEKLFSTYLIPGLDPASDPALYRRCVDNARKIGKPDPDSVDWGRAEFPEDQDMDGKDDRWYVMDQSSDILWAGDDTDGDGRVDFVHADKGMDGIYEYSAYRLQGKWQQTNLVEAWLEMGFTLPWSRKSYHRHDVDIVFNNQVIGRLRDTIPNGNYTFRIPPRLIHFNEQGMPTDNIIGVSTRHLRGGHYVVNSDFRFNFRLTATPVWSVGRNAEDAYQKALAIDGLSLTAPDYSISSSDMQLKGPEILETGMELQVRARIRNLGACSTPSVTVALFDKRPGQDRKEVIRKQIEDIPVSGAVPITLPWRSTGGEHQLSIVIDPDRELEDNNRVNNEAELSVSIPGDDEPPELALLQPAPDAVLTSPVTSLRVRASDANGLTSVGASVDGGLWQTLDHEGGDIFTARLLLQPGPHRIMVRAVDASSNEKKAVISLRMNGDRPRPLVVFPKANSEILSRSCPLMIKVPPQTVCAAARVNGGPWHRAKLSGGFGQVTLPLHYGKQDIETMVVRKDGIAGNRNVTVTCTRQPGEGVQEKNDTAEKGSSGLVYIAPLGRKVDFFSQWNHVLTDTTEPAFSLSTQKR